MPGKHVHFNAPSQTPSPSFSTSTLTSSPAPPTPPSLGPGSPYHTIPLPVTGGALHPILAFAPVPVAPCDLRRPPPPLPAYTLAEPACFPPVPLLEIRCPMLPWGITILPRGPDGWVSVADARDALYRALRTNVTAVEFALVPTQSQKDAISEAYRTRCAAAPSRAEYESEKAKGLKRIDFLGPRTTFMGLAPGKGGWTLVVA